MESRLSIEIDDDSVVFFGTMNLREAYDFINYFDKEGYDTIHWGEQNSCLHLIKSKKASPEDSSSPHHDEFLKLYEERDQLKKKISDLEKIIKMVCDGNNFRPVLQEFHSATLPEEI